VAARLSRPEGERQRGAGRSADLRRVWDNRPTVARKFLTSAIVRYTFTESAENDAANPGASLTMNAPILTAADSHVDATFVARLNRRAARRASGEARAARIAARYEARVAAGREDAEDVFEMTAPDC